MSTDRFIADKATIRAELERRARARQTITYGEAADLIGRATQGLGKILTAIRVEEASRRRPDLGARRMLAEVAMLDRRAAANLAARQGGASDRVLADVGQAIGPAQNADAYARTIADAGRATSAPFYDRAAAAGQPYTPDLAGILGRPAVSSALQDTATSAANAGRPLGSITLDAAGQPRGAVPAMSPDERRAGAPATPGRHGVGQAGVRGPVHGAVWVRLEAGCRGCESAGLVD